MRLLFVFLCIANIVKAQLPHYFRHFTEKDGLSTNAVNCIFRDNQGFLWVGTNYGLNRYDGKKFKQYLPSVQQANQTVSNEFINAIDQDKEGFVWVATRKGLNRYNPMTQTFKVWQNTGRDDGSLPNSLVNNLYLEENAVWLACDNRDLCRLDNRTGNFTSFPWKKFAEAAIPSQATRVYKNIYSISRKDENELWLHTNLGVFSFNKHSAQFTYYPINLAELKSANTPKCTYNFYFGSWDQDVLRYESCLDKWSKIMLPITDKGGFRRVVSVERYSEDFWILAAKGLFRFNPQKAVAEAIKPDYGNNFSAPTGLLNAFYKEKNGLVWLGGENGLWQVDPHLQHFNHVQLVPSSTPSVYNRFSRVLDVPELHRRFITDFYAGKIWVYENMKLIKTIQLEGAAGILTKDRSGNLWVSGGNKIHQLDPKRLTLTSLLIPAELMPSTSKSYFPTMSEDAQGNLWFGNNMEGLYVLRKKTGEWEKPGESTGFISKSVSSIFADTLRKTVWIGTDDYGLFRYDEAKETFHLYQHEEDTSKYSIGGHMVLSICRDKLGNIWAATDPGGVSRFDYNAPPERAFITLNTQNGLPSNQATALLSDQSGNIWVGTTKGLAYIDAETLRLRKWSSNSGLRNDYIDLPLCLGAAGEVIWGGKTGYEYFFPDSLLAEQDEERILLTSFKVFDREMMDKLDIGNLNNITLKWEDRFFSTEFTSANFSRSELNEYLVRLTGFDKDWKNITTHDRAVWTNVPPGKYEMEVKTLREGKASDAKKLFSVHIKPPFWQTWWFRLLTFSALIGTFWRIYRYRIAQVRKQEQLKAEYNKRIAQVEMTALRAQMNPHFVFNCLNSINRFILVNEPDAASEYLTKFSRLIRLILDNSLTETVPLDKELAALRLYIDMEAMRFDGRFSYEITIEPNLQTDLIEVPPLLIQPFVENAIWHGLMHQKDKGLLSIRVFKSGEGIGVSVEDNGVGREKAKELKSKSATTHKSHGMELTAERLKIIESIYAIKTTVEVKDLYDSKGSPCGTRVNITYNGLEHIS